MELGLELAVLDEAGVEVVVRVLVDLGLGDGAVAAVSVLFNRALGRGDELGEHPGERVHLVAAELRPGGRARLVLGEDAL